jgi:DNA-directed RNA polymerase subunit RPC12/RpoP
MAKNICPRCSQITISFECEEEIQCPVCETVFLLTKVSNEEKLEKQA